MTDIKNYSFTLPSDVWDDVLEAAKKGRIGTRSDTIKIVILDIISGVIDPPEEMNFSYGELKNEGHRGNVKLSPSVWIDPRTGRDHESYKTLTDRNFLIRDICYALARGRISVQTTCVTKEG